VKKGYLWNSGIFLLSIPVFFEELKKYQPHLSAAFGSASVPEYAKLASISIDYGLPEPSKKVAVVPHDAEGNVGTAECLSARDSYVQAPGKHVGMIGVDNLVVVDTADALLICDKRHTEQVKDLIHRYKKRDDPVTRFHRQVHRPWGLYTVLEDAKGYKIKRMTVKPNRKLSLQLHHHRSEHWVVVSGDGGNRTQR
jgi:mannose-1-phosphate guanylyltransferase/mannose-6-phosphate isomerase